MDSSRLWFITRTLWHSFSDIELALYVKMLDPLLELDVDDDLFIHMEPNIQFILIPDYKLGNAIYFP